MPSSNGVLYLRTQLVGASSSNKSAGGVLFFPLRLISGFFTAGGGFTNDTAGLGRKKVIFPRRDIPLIDPTTGLLMEQWYRWFDYVNEVKLGGVLGPSIKDAQINVEAAQNAINTISTQVSAVQAQATANAASTAAIIEVAKNSDLPGADQIPPARITTEAIT